MTTRTTSSYWWCYSCRQFVSVLAEQGTSISVACSHCDGGFIEEFKDSSSLASTEDISIEFSPLPHRYGLLRAGFGYREVELILGEDIQIEAWTTRVGSFKNSWASKPAIETMPIVEISDCHISAEANCAVCMNDFELETKVRELPCKHIFHEDCITPWFSIRNSCPLCRLELPSNYAERMKMFSQIIHASIRKKLKAKRGSSSSPSSNLGDLNNEVETRVLNP